MRATENFKLFLNGREVTEQEIRDCKESMSVSIDGINCFYSFSPKIENKIESDYIGFIGSNMRRGKAFKYSTPIDKTICASDIVNSAKKLETEEIKDDVITNTNRGEQALIQWLDNIVKEKDNFNKSANELFPEETEKLVFTTLEKELTSEKQQGHLSTRHKKPTKMYLDEVLADIAEKENQTNFHQVKTYKEEKIGNVTTSSYTQYPMTPDESFKVSSETGEQLFFDKGCNLISAQKTEKQGIKETVNKTDYSEVNLGVLDLMAERFTANKYKYPKGNSLKPIDKKELCWALFRHVKKMIKEESNDPETFKNHLAAVLCNGSMILDQLEIKTN